MKTRRSDLFRCAILIAPLVASLSTNASAQLTWDITPGIVGPGDEAITGGAGTWDDSNGNWTSDAGINNVAWDNTGATTANFSAAIPPPAEGVATQLISIGPGLIVGDLTKTTGQIMQFQGSAAADQVMAIKSGGATWDTGGNAIAFLTAGDDAGLSMTSGDTLTVNGGGGFQAIGAPTAAWAVSGATLDYTGATGQIRGRSETLGQFATVKIAGVVGGGGTRFLHDSGNGQAYANNFELTGTGQVAFDSNGSLNYTLNGDISGTAGMRTEFTGTRTITLNGDNSAWTGGLEVAQASKVAVSNVNELGSGNVTLSGTNTNFGVLLLANVDMGSSRELHVNGTGGAIVNQGVNAFGGKITGSGPLQIGHANHDNNTNRFIVSGTNSDHTGITRVYNGTLQLGADDALSHATVLQLGGEKSSLFEMDGFDAEVSGLTIAANNTRRVDNIHAADISTLTINVADTVSYVYPSAFALSGPGINIVKNGLGSQSLTNAGANAVAITVNAGSLVFRGTDADSGTVNDGILSLTAPAGDLNLDSLTVDGATSSLALNETTMTGSLTVNNNATLNLSLNETLGLGLTASPVTLGPDGTVTLNLNYGDLALGNPIAAAITDIGFDTFDPSSTSITINVAGTGFAVGEVKLIDYEATSPLVDIANFSLGTIPDGLVATLVHNTVDQSIDLSITVASSPYESWATSKGLTPPDAGEDDDKEGDTISNILEWVLGGDPLVSDTGILPTTTKSGTDLIFSFNRADSTIGEVTLTVQSGSDLLGWTDVVVPATTGGIFEITDNGDTDGVVATIPVGAATEQFVRLKAE